MASRIIICSRMGHTFTGMSMSGTPLGPQSTARHPPAISMDI